MTRIFIIRIYILYTVAVQVLVVIEQHQKFIEVRSVSEKSIEEPESTVIKFGLYEIAAEPWSRLALESRSQWVLCTGTMQALPFFVETPRRLKLNIEIQVSEFATCNPSLAGRGLFSQMDPSVTIHSDVVTD